ncbi:MAG: DUF362 domain-containing protein [Halanaerobiales bacterium]
MRQFKGTARKVKTPIVSITGNRYEGDAIREAVDLLPVNEIIGRGDTVVITPNWVQDKPPETGVVVGPESLRQLIRYIKERDPGQIVIATGSGGDPTQQVMENVGYKKVIEEEGVEFIDLNHGDFITVELNHHSPGTTKLHKLIEELDVLISFTQIKVHQEATVSLGIKNIALGWPPTEEHGAPKMDKGIHRDLHGFIRAMGEKIPIDLTILSGDQGMVGTGPSGGKPVNSDLIVAGTDPVATDVVGTRLLGFRPQAVRYLYDLIREGIGVGDLNKVQLRGIPLNEAERIFSWAAYGHDVILDKDELLSLHI